MSALLHAWAAVAPRSIFPMGNRKNPLTSSKRNGARWGQSNDPAEIEAWAREFPRAGAGLPTGENGLLVVDVDPKSGGTDSLRMIEERHGPMPMTVRTRSPSEGVHFWFASTGEPWMLNTVHVLARGIDTRGQGGFVALPPSPGKTGPYRWVEGRSPLDVAVAPLPAWISAALRQHHERRRFPAFTGPIPSLTLDRRVRLARAYLARVPGAIEGNGGDHATFVAAAICRDFGLDEREALAMLLAWNEKCSPPWSREELEQKINNAFSYATGAPGARLARTA